MQLSQRSSLPACGVLAAVASIAMACSNVKSAPQRPATATVQTVQAREHEAPEPGTVPDFSETLDAYIQSIGAGWGPAQRPTGFVAVWVQGQTRFAKGYGVANLETGAPHTLDTSYRIGSITKGLTAAAVLKLEAAGLLSTTDAIGAHIGNYPQVGRGIQLHQLLTHTAGLPNYTSDRRAMARRNRATSPAELLELFWDKPLDFEPGSTFSYSNSGYVVLGAVIEAATGSTYSEYMDTQLLQPLGLGDTVVGDAPDAPRQAIGYTRGPEDTLQPAPAMSMSVPFAAGGMRSTPEDLLRWHEALGSDELLPEPLRKRLFEPGKGNYGYGFVIGQQDGHTVASHGGAIDGFMGAFMRVEALDIAVVVLLNADTVPAEPIAEAALKLAMGHEVAPLQAEPPLPLTPDMIVLTEGRYVLSESSVEELRRRGMPAQRINAVARALIFKSGDTLKFKPSGQPAVRLVAVSLDRLRLLGTSAELRVVQQGHREQARTSRPSPEEPPQPDRSPAAQEVSGETNNTAQAPGQPLSEREASWAPTAIQGRRLPVAEIVELTQGPLRLRYERVQAAAEEAPTDDAEVDPASADRAARRKARRSARKARRRREYERKGAPSDGADGAATNP